MCKRSTFLVCIVLILGLAGFVSAELIAYWRFDGDFIDVSGNGHDGTPFGDPVIVADPVRGQVLETNGMSRVRVADAEVFNYEQNESFSYMIWANYDPGLVGAGWRTIFVKGRTQDGGGTSYNAEALYGFWVSPDGNWHVSCGGVRADTDPAPANEWHHLAAVQDGDADTVTFYIDGQAIPAGSGSAGPCVSPDWPLFFGAAGTDQSAFEAFGGRIDEAQIYNHPLIEDELLSAMQGAGAYPYALGPDPADGAIHEDTWITLSWRPGDLAVSHDVYLGDDYDVVDNATRDSEVFRGNQITDFYVAGFPGFAYPEGLVPGTTYYWRIDEVNDADPNSPWKGDVWSFSIPPKTAYNPDPADGDGIAETTVTLRWTAGFGAKLHTIYFGDDFDTVANAAVGMPVGTTTYNPGPLEAEKVYYWRVDEFDGLATHTGDVWAFTTPGAVGHPQPANGADDVAMATVLSWRAADNAASHEVYLGLNKDTVHSADTTSPEFKGVKALGGESYDAGWLEPDTTYYWRIDEVYTGNTVKGPVWTFTVGAYLLVEDFESYTDDDAAGQAVWQTWIDGFGVADNGAQVGYLMPPYAEQTIVHGGGQSMPLSYTNEAGVTNSEGAMTLTAPRDWTAAGVSELSLWFRGESDNAEEPLYAAISNSTGSAAVAAQDDPSAATGLSWTQWRIPLQVFSDQGINLTDVDKLAIGLGSQSGIAAAGGSGTIYIDDIRLYRPGS